MSTVTDRYWVVMSPDDQGAIVAKMQTSNDFELPSEIADYSGFIVVSAPDVSGLSDKTVDQSGLSSDEIDRIRTVFPE